MSKQPFVFRVCRPWWWLLNPWLYALRRDRAYEAAIDIVYDQAVQTQHPERAYGVAT